MGLSRLIGILREFMISVAFGISRLTDIFYQVSWPITAINTISNGPFLTSLSSIMASQSLCQKKSAVLYYKSISLWLSIAIFSASILLSIVLYLCERGELAIISFLIGLSAATSTTTGYYYAATVSLGRLKFGSLILLCANLTFSVLVIFLYILIDKLEYWHLPLTLTISCIMTLIFCCVTQRDFFSNSADASNVTPRPVSGFLKSFLLSSAETAAFLSSQALIVYLSTLSGEGWLSAILLTQKIIFSINGLILSPFASMLMMRVAKCEREEALHIFKRGVGIALLGLFSIMCISLLLSFNFEHIVSYYFGEYDYGQGMHLVIQVIPAVSFWLLPTGVNIILCRTMFATGQAQSYTFIAIASYIASSAIRLIVFHMVGINFAIMIGAAVELAFTLILFITCHKKLTENKEINKDA